ncbi:hypothetical protein HL658_31320 [Azospirillum sp. RWY-5-1]|uniref:Phage portal protein n=1 Tax=Azospirillum oleiclasticum TaxID=2735135 RepID=A0ABX2TN06_9PROT|nr:hypothetical protein [Azospirillum oleiclasticum]NYZ17056.1 hypothetical protein [Azospirillum oleiclasticum]NYZ24500.1 hypothetical protein [Azospirillum oleiclasticum]
MGVFDPFLRLMAAAFPPAVVPAGRPMREAAGAAADPDDEDGTWRPVGADTARDLSPITQERMQRIAAWAWERNRLANRLIELPLAMLLAEGWTLECDDADAQGWLDAFVRDPINRLDRRFKQYARELALFGEQCWRVYGNEVSGAIRLGYVDPGAIEAVVTDPDNVAQPIGVVVRKRSGDRRVYRVILPGDDADLFGEGARALRAGMTGGDCFFFRVNGLVAGKRGRSDLLSAVDKCDAYDEMLFGEIERGELQRHVLWDVTLTGADQAECDRRAANLPPPRARTVRVHNENEAWQAVVPQLAAGDADTALRTLRNDILGGASLPEHWYGSGGDVNRATALAMGDPTYKVLTDRQNELKAILEEVGTYVVWRRAAALGRAADPADPALRVRAVFPDLVTRDVAAMAAALGQVVGAAAGGVSQGLLSRETAVRLIALVATQLGQKIDAAAELAKAEKEEAAAAEDDVYAEPAEDEASPLSGEEPA